MTTNELQHHGILGMKWGIRRYQNEDGSYTKAGRKRYGLDLDVNDTSRSNIAKIRTGEAKRRLDVAKANNSTNTVRIAELQQRVRSAKKNEKDIKRADKGAARVAKGETIRGNTAKVAAVALGMYAASKMMDRYLGARLEDLYSQERLSAGHALVAAASSLSVHALTSGVTIGYALKKHGDNKNIRAYNSKRATGGMSIKSVGSQEYADRVKSSKNG